MNFLSVIVSLLKKIFRFVFFFQILRNTSHAKDKVEDASRVTLKNLQVCVCVCVCVCAGLAGVCV